MSLKSLMTADLTRVFLNTSAFAESGTYTPQDGTGFTLKFCPSDAAPAASMGDGGIRQEASITITASKAAFDAGTTNKAPLRGDLLVIASGDMAGTWRVDTWWADSGGGISMVCVRSEQSTISANGSREV